MAVATDAGRHGNPTVPTGAEILAIAGRIVPDLVARQAETEQRTYYAPDTHQAFVNAGFYRILVPRRYGGYELGVDTFIRVVQTLTAACPSTGWMYCLGAAHALAAASLFAERAQAELFAGGDFICPATVAPTGTARRSGEDGWHVSGTWNYCSGSPYATHFMGHALVTRPEGEPVPLLFVAPRECWRVMDDWGTQLGLRGSGSHSITIDGAYIPDRFTLPYHLSQADVTSGTEGRRLHGPQYGGGQLSFMVIEDAVLALGMAQAALSAYEQLMEQRSTIFPPIVPRREDADFQQWYGTAAGLIATAEAAVHQVVTQWQELSAGPPADITAERELRMAAVCHEVTRLCWRAVAEYLYPTAGSSAVRRGERMERVWRDMCMQRTHAGIAVFLGAIGKRELARAHFGVA